MKTDSIPVEPKKKSSVPKSLSGQKEITKIIAVSSDKVLPSDAAQAAYSSGHLVTLKETCYGLVLTGTKENVDAVVEIVQNLDKNHIFVKDRGFPTGDPRRCRAVRNGGQRPGFYTLHEEISKMGTIGEALDDYDAKVKKTNAEWPDKPSSFKLEDYINREFGKSEKKVQTQKIIADKIKSRKENSGSRNKKAAAEKTTAKKTAAEKAMAKKTATEKAIVKKTAAEKAMAKKTAAEKAMAKKTAAEKTTAKKTAENKAVSKAAASKNAPAKKTAKTAAEKKTAPAKK